MTSSSSDVAWKMTSYGPKRRRKFVTFNFSIFLQKKKRKKEKMPAILIQLQIVLPKSNSAKMISSDIALVQK